MRPETFRQKMNKAITRYMGTGDTVSLRRLMPEAERVWSKWATSEGDYRSGEESYGYGKFNPTQFEYVSDRWQCAFRLKWIIDGVKNGHFDCK